MDWYLTPVPVFYLLLCEFPVISRTGNLLRLALKPFNCEETEKNTVCSYCQKGLHNKKTLSFVVPPVTYETFAIF